MTEMRPDVDLGAFERPPPRPRPRRRAGWFVVGTIVAGAAALLAWGFRDVLRPSVEVTVIRPRPLERSAARATAFQAAGWVEPDPFARRVVPLTHGVILDVLVQESDRVNEGDVVARLVPDDATLELQQAEAELAAARAERERARVELDAATIDFDEAIALGERVEVATAVHQSREEEERLHGAAVARGQAEVRVADEELELQKVLQSQSAAGTRQVELAEARRDVARAALVMLEARAAQATADRTAAAATRRAARREQELRTEDRRRVETARHVLASAEAGVARAVSALELARLRVDRLDVRSPWAGVVLERLIEPGSGIAGHRDVAVCSLYDPERLRVRVDVPFEEVAATSIGQAAEIVCDARPGRPYRGEVTRRVQLADVQKVTLEVQVRVVDPDEALRPDMVCQVRFLGASNGGPTDPADGPDSVAIPVRLLVGGDRVWVVGASEARARLRRVEVQQRDGDWVEVSGGLNATDKLIDDGRDRLEEGRRVHIVEGAR